VPLDDDGVVPLLALVPRQPGTPRLDGEAIFEAEEHGVAQRIAPVGAVLGIDAAGVDEDRLVAQRRAEVLGVERAGRLVQPGARA
jgi:hypothetical protein